MLRLSGTPDSWFETFTNNLAVQVYFAAMIWIFYLAIEPYVRRFWPETLVAWGRVLDGRFRDPMVGRHILIGALAGMGVTLLISMPDLVRVFGMAPPQPIVGNLDAVASFPLRFAQLFGIVQESFFIPVACLLAVLVFRVIFRRPWLAYGVLILLPGIARHAWAEARTRGSRPRLPVPVWQRLSRSPCWSSLSSRALGCSRCWS